MAELQKDLVLSPNEYSYVLDETKGNVACNVGPHKMSLSQSDTLVYFDTKTKKFIPCNRYEDAIQLVTTAPEGWYIALKNPAPGNKHPQPGTSNSIPENMEIGKKINIPGPISFALYPGQMAQVIQGHTLRSNQYLVAKVYDADSLNTTKEDRDASENEPYFVNGQVLIIKGTEISFYIPPTGIEVKAINNDPWFSVDNYVKHMCDWCRSAIKRAAKEFSIRELHDNYHDIVVEAITTDENTEYLHKFMENGMQISDVEVLSINIESNIQALMDRHQEEVVSRSLELAAAQASAETEREIIALNREKVELAEQYAQYKAQLEADTKAKQFELIIAAQKARDEEDKRKYQIEQDIQVIKDAIFEAERARKEKDNDLELAHKKQMLELEATREAAAAESMKTVLAALGPDLAAALKTSGNQAVVESIAGAIAPYAIAEGKPVSRAVSELLRGTTLESVFEDFAKKNN